MANLWNLNTNCCAVIANAPEDHKNSIYGAKCADWKLYEFKVKYDEICGGPGFPGFDAGSGGSSGNKNDQGTSQVKFASNAGYTGPQAWDNTPKTKHKFECIRREQSLSDSDWQDPQYFQPITPPCTRSHDASQCRRYDYSGGGNPSDVDAWKEDVKCCGVILGGVPLSPWVKCDDAKKFELIVDWDQSGEKTGVCFDGNWLGLELKAYKYHCVSRCEEANGAGGGWRSASGGIVVVISALLAVAIGSMGR
jgi:hypothetical protein